MSITSKSPRAVALAALSVASKALPAYAHRNSPKVYTQPQLFACLVLKVFFRTDYRGVEQLLLDLPDLVAALGLKAVPDHSTLHRAAKRLLLARPANRLLTAVVRGAMRRRRSVALAALDSSGFDCGHISAYFVRRRSRARGLWQTCTYTRFAKLELAVDCSTHLILCAIPGRGPRVDVDRFAPLLGGALSRARITTALADAGYDSEANHRHAREARGVRSVIPAAGGRPTDKPPTGRYRRRMRRHLTEWAGFLYCSYGQRWQVETVFSMIKRRQGSAVHARSYPSQSRELMLMALTHNLMVLAARE